MVERHVEPGGTAPGAQSGFTPTLELTIQRRRDGAWPVVAEHSAGPGELPSRAEGRLCLDLDILYTDGPDPRAYGERLGAALFDGVIRDALATALAAGNQIRLLLTIEDAELSALRWELLCAPLGGTWRHLALSQRVLFSRYEPSLADRRFPPIGPRDLRAVVLAASPAELPSYQLAPFDAAGSASGVARAMGALPATILADGAARQPSLEALCRCIVAEAPTILHLICHGRVLDDGESVLYLSDDAEPRKVRPVTGGQLIERLASLAGARSLPHLIVLAACESAAPAATAALGNLAQRLVRELGTPAVVAMADKVSVATAEALATAFYPRLAEHGYPDRALAEALTTLQGRDDVLVPGLYGRLGGRPLFSDSLARPLTPAEIRNGLERLAALVATRAPVLAPELAAAADALGATLGVEAAALAPDLRREREATLAQVGAICEEATELSFAAVALDRPVPSYDPTCPFPGLSAFQADERRFFFGREALVARLEARLAARPFLAVLGPSGSGKSSLIRAGLIPALQARHPRLAVTAVTPGTHPVERLRATLRADLSAGPPGPRLILVDQLEELFTLCADEGERVSFVDQLLGLGRKAPVVVTLRADFWGEVAPYPRLREAMQAGQELIGPLTPAELRSAIEQQAAAVGLRFEGGLGGRILDDVAGEPGAMPLLQHALAELWKRRRGRWLRAAEYEAIGGVARAIAHTADGIYLALGAAERERLRDIFVRLTRLDPEAGAEARRDTRRRVALAELVPAGGDAAATRELVRRLADARLVVTGVGSNGAQEVEVAHEALIRAWPRLQGWLSEDRQGLRVRETVRQAALEWDEATRDESRLVHRGARLDEAAAVAALPRFAPNARERAYLDACLELRRREQQEEEAERRRELKAAQDLAAARAATVRRTRSLAIVVGVVALVAIGAAIFAGYQNEQANKARTTAQENERKAIAAEATAQRTARQARAGELAALAGRAASPQLGALLAVEAMGATMDEGEAPVSAAREALYETLGRIGGEGLATITPFAGEGRSGRLDRFLEPIGTVDVSPDARYVLTSQGGGPIWLWDTASPATAVYTLTLDGADVENTTFSPDGRWLVTIGEKTTLLRDLHDLARAPITLPRGEPGPAPTSPLNSVWHLVAFGADGAIAATAAEDGLNVFRVGDVAPERLGGDSSSMPRALSVSPDGTLVASALPGDDSFVKSVRVWTTAPFGVLRDVPLPPEMHVTWLDLAFAPDSRWLLIYLGSGPFKGTSALLVDLVEPDSTPEALDFALPRPMAITDEGAFIADGTLFTRSGEGWWQEPLDFWNEVSVIALNGGRRIGALGTVGGQIVLFTTDGPRYLTTLPGHETRVSSLGFTPDGRTLVSADEGGQVRRWDLSGDPVNTSTQPIQVAAGPSIYAAGPGGSSAAWTTGTSVEVLDLEATPPRTSTYSLPIPGTIEGPYTGSVSADGRRVVAVDGERGRLTVLDLAPGGEARTLLELEASEGDLSPDGRWLFTNASGADASFNALYDLDAPQHTRTSVNWMTGSWFDKAFSPDGHWLMLAPGEGNQVLWRLDGAKPEGPLVADTGEEALLKEQVWLMEGTFSADGSRFAACDESNLYVWDVSAGAPGKPIVSLPIMLLETRMNVMAGEEYIPALALSADGRQLAISRSGGAISLVDLATKKVRPLQGHSQDVQTIAFSADGAWLATADYATVRLWPLTQAQPASITLLRLQKEAQRESEPQIDLIFRRDGDLVVLENGAPARLYNLDPAALIRMACAAAGRNLSPAEWHRYFPDTVYRPTCPGLPPHPELIDQKLVEVLDNAAQGKTNEARASLAKAVELEPRQFVSSTVWHTLCQAELKAGEHARALEHCEQAVRLDEDFRPYRETRALARALSGDLAGAAADLRFAADLDEQHFQTSMGDADQLRAWAGELEAGRNPFTPELVRQLLEQRPAIVGEG